MTLSAEAPQAHANVSMTPAEWQVLVLVDGHRTVAEIAELAEVENEVAMQMLHGLTSAGLIELAHAGPGAGVLGQAHPPAASPSPLPGRIGDGPRPSYDLLGGPGPEIEGDESEYFLKPAAEEPGAWPEAAPEAQEVDAAQAGMDTEIVETGAGPTGSPPASESSAATASQSGPADPPPDVATDPGGSEIEPSPDSETADPLAPILEETGGWPEGPSPGALDDWFADSDTTFEGFDLPAPGELITEEPGETSTAEVDDAPVENEFEDEAGGDSVPAETNGLLTSAPSQGTEALLASADDLGDFPEPARKRVEDDERVTKGLINRLIEGLKGL
jgi:hypothetical protein